MNTREIQSAIASNEYFKKSRIGVYPADLIPGHLEKGQSCILNCVKSFEPGRHWLLLFQKEADEVEFFCSYGKAPEFYHQEWNSVLLKRNKKVLFNTRQVQNFFSNTCGIHCLLCLYFRCLGVSFPTIVSSVYKSNTCFNDSFVVAFVNKLVRYDLTTHLSEPVQICENMKSVLSV